MDPVSVAASLLTLVSAASTTGRALEQISNVRHAPDQLLALVNEVSAFYFPVSHDYIFHSTLIWMSRLQICGSWSAKPETPYKLGSRPPKTVAVSP